MTATTTRTTKTPAERAQEAVDILQRRIVKLRGKALDARNQADALGKEIAAVQGRLDYALKHPDLPPQPTDQESADRAQ